MAWFARSIANSLKFDDEEEEELKISQIRMARDREIDGQQDATPSPSSPGRGVKDDLSELTNTITRQFWGVASFLAPPPRSHSSLISNLGIHQSYSSDGADPGVIGEIRSDFSSMDENFRTGSSIRSNDREESDFTEMSSNFIQLKEDERDNDCDWLRCAVGVTDEVVAFVRDIAMHPETWLDFPLPEDEEDEDFDMSIAQHEHALAVEHLVPQLAALKIELCLGYMSEGWFWKIYFVFLRPRLDKQATELLITPQIVKARALLNQDLHHQTMTKQDWSDRSTSYSRDMDTTTYSRDINGRPFEDLISVPSTARSESQSFKDVPINSATLTVADDFEKDKYTVQSTEIPIVEKSVVQEGPNNKKEQNFNHCPSSDVLEAKDEDDWLKEECFEVVGVGENAMHFDNVEDVSFSDLEEDDGYIPVSDKKVIYSSDLQRKDSQDRVE